MWESKIMISRLHYKRLANVDQDKRLQIFEETSGFIVCDKMLSAMSLGYIAP